MFALTRICEPTEGWNSPMASEKTLKFDDQNFDAEVLRSSTPVLVDFWAEWCGPCLTLAPTIDELAAEYAGRVKVGKLDIDKSPATPGKYGVMNIPTVILFENGEPVQRIVGLRPKKDFKAILDAKVSAA
jgi:thioredoxin 1